jgi:hypothetical protein
MPRGKSKSDVKAKSDPNAGRRYYAPSDAAWGGYVDLKLDEDRRADFDNWFQETGQSAMAHVFDALVEGLVLGCRWDEANQCYLATFTGAGVSNSNERYVLTARSGDFSEALALLVYKHTVLMAGDWGDFRPRTGQLRQWG